MPAPSNDPRAPLLACAPSTSYSKHPVTDTESLKPHDGDAKEPWLWWAVKCAGPGFMLGLANSSASDLLAAAQAGAKFNFLYTSWTVLLTIPQYLGMELITRLCIVNQKSFASMIAEACGREWTLVSLLMLGVSCLGGLVTQIWTVVAVGDMWGFDGVPVCLFITCGFVAISLADNLTCVERFGICLGLFESAFCASAVLASPNLSAIVEDISNFYVTFQIDHSIVTGSIVSKALEPWVLLYQGASVVHRRRAAVCKLDQERVDIAVGTIATQLTMSGMVVTFAAAMGEGAVDLNSLAFADISASLATCLPHAKILFSMGMLGASFVAALAILLVSSWAVEEVVALGFLGNASDAAGSMAAQLGFAAALLVACSLALAQPMAMEVAYFCDILNAVNELLAIAFLLYLCEYHLPEEYAVVGVRKVMTIAVMLSIGICGMFTALCRMSAVALADSDPVRMPLVEDGGVWSKVLLPLPSTPADSTQDSTAPVMDYLCVAVPMVAAQHLIKHWATK